MDTLQLLRNALLSLSALLSISTAQAQTPLPGPVLSEPEPPAATLALRTEFLTDRDYAFYLLDRLAPSAQAFTDLHLIAVAESGYKSKIKNPDSTATGLFQITAPTWREFSCSGVPTDELSNVQCAIRIYQKTGTERWDASKAGWAKPIPSV